MLTFLTALLLFPAPATPADADCTLRNGAWLCGIGATSTPRNTGGNSHAGSAEQPGIRVEPMCATTGGADHCITLPETPRVSTADVVEMARDAMALPPPRAHTSPSTRTWVGLRTFLWIDRSAWRPHSASVSVDGQTVTMTGRPTHVVWDLSEATITCHGPGAPRSPECSYTYRRSNVQPYDIKATLYYSVSWSCTGACDTPGGTFDPLPTASHLRLSVREIQTATTR